MEDSSMLNVNVCKYNKEYYNITTTQRPTECFIAGCYIASYFSLVFVDFLYEKLKLESQHSFL